MPLEEGQIVSLDDSRTERVRNHLTSLSVEVVVLEYSREPDVFFRLRMRREETECDDVITRFLNAHITPFRLRSW